MIPGNIGPPAGKAGYALIVGIGQYRDQRIPKLQFTHSDAEQFYRLLIDPQRSAIPKDNVKMLLDEEATLYTIKNAISGWLFQHVTPDSTVMVYFAGHGGLESDKLGMEKDGLAKYLLPWDADLDNLFASALSNLEFNALLSTVKAQRLVIFMDACYAGGVTRKGARDLGLAENPYIRLAEGQGRLVIASAQPNQRSWEDAKLGHGIFTYHLLEAMRGKADTDNDGCVSVIDVFRYLEKSVPESARRIASSVQEPLLCGDISKDIVVAVDSEKISQLARARSEAERRRREEIREKRRKLFELHDQGDLPVEVYRDAVPLIDKDPSELTPEEKRQVILLDALLKDKISAKEYLEAAGAIQYKSRSRAEPPPPPPPVEPRRPEPPNLASRDATPPPPKHQETAPKYCIRCGAKVIPENAFCIGCGTKYSFGR